MGLMIESDSSLMSQDNYKEFLEWLESKNSEYLEIQNLLEQVHDTTSPDSVSNSVAIILSKADPLSSMLAEAEKFLDKLTADVMPLKDKSVTEADRKVYVENKLAGVREVRNKLEGSLKALFAHLSFGESLMYYEGGKVRKGL